MYYHEYAPHPLLSTVVECYWSFTSDVIQRRTVFPDSCADIIFNFGDPMVVSANGVASRSKGIAFVVGMMTHSIFTTGSGRQDLFGIRFKAGGLSAVVRNPLHEFTDHSLSIDDCAHCMPAQLTEKMRETDVKIRVTLVDHWLISSITLAPEKNSWRWAVNRILSAHGDIRIKALAQESAMSEKQLERKFLQHVGVTPKTLSSIARFCEAKRRLERSNLPLEGLAWDLGYTDHAHFTKSFKLFAGLSPSEFVQKEY
ncbi:MAG TPA: AraC family transcriptional regulator [Cyclobacteriaceae bacterium]|nr:AraC family transcriptional regulator [Cyclobacteriaceae bacterium]